MPEPQTADTGTATAPPPQYSPDEFAAQIKAKYPVYKDWPTDHLVNEVTTKHPEYKSWVKTAPAQATPEAIERNKQESPFEKENKPSFLGEAMRTAEKIPLKVIGIDTNAGGRSGWSAGLGAGYDWVKQNAKAALDAVNPFRVGAPSMVKDVVHGMDDTSREGEIISRTGRSVEPAAANETGAFQNRPGGPVQKLGAELEHPQLASALRTAASMVPVVGPSAVHAGHSLARATNTQEAGEALADAGGTAGQAFLMSEPGQRFTNQAIEKVGGGVNRSIVKPVANAASSAVERFKTPEAQRAMTQAIQPGVNIPRAQESIGIAGPRMQQVREATGREVNNTGDALELNRDAKKVVLKAIEDRVGPVADLQPDTSTVAKAMRGSMDNITRKQYGAAADAIEKRASVYDEGGHTFRDIENRIQTLNNHLANFYKQATPGENPVSMHAEADLAEVKELRDVLDKGVENLSGDGVKDLKREYGAQRDVEKALARQHAVTTRQKGAGLWEGLAYLHAAGELASGNLMGAAKSAATLAAGKRLATLRNPNFLLKQAFHGKDAFEAAEAIPAHAGPPAPHGLLPKPATEAGFTQEDASGSTRGGRYTTPAAQLGNDNPIEAKFIREIPKASRSPQAQLPRSAQSLDFMRQAMGKVPPAVDERFARESTSPVQGHEWADERRQGPFGEGGIRTTPKGELRGTSSEDARSLIQQTLDMMRSGDRPGRYYDENEMGDYNPQKEQSASRGVTSGGRWRGVSSMRTMLPWLQDNDFSPAELERALKAFDKGKVTSAMASAMKFVEREAAERSQGNEAEPGGREPGDESEEEAPMPAVGDYKPSKKAQEMSAPRQSLGPEWEAGELSHEISRYKSILQNPKATLEERAMASAKLRELQEEH